MTAWRVIKKTFFYLYVSKRDLVRGVGVYLRVRASVMSCLLMMVISEVIKGMVRMLVRTVSLNKLEGEGRRKPNDFGI